MSTGRAGSGEFGHSPLPQDKIERGTYPVDNSAVVYTIGHSTRTIREFVDILTNCGIEVVADVRTVPRSRHNPQFNGDALPLSLRAAGIGYVHLKALGGLRRALRESLNTGWRNSSFRGFADYMQTAEFGQAIEDLSREAVGKRIALMCAEAVPWRCHRSLIADALTVRGISVVHIISAGARHDHKLTPFAEVHGARITYPAL